MEKWMDDGYEMEKKGGANENQDRANYSGWTNGDSRICSVEINGLKNVNLLDIVWSTLSIDGLFPTVWIFDIVCPAFSRW